MKKRSVLIINHNTSVSVEEPFWEALKRIAHDRGVSLNALIAQIDQTRTGNLSSALRLAVLEDLERRCGLWVGKDD